MIAAVAAVIVSLYIHWDSSAPHVVIYLELDTDKNVTSLVVKNLGRAPAYDINFSGFDLEAADLPNRRYLEKCFLYRGIPMLVQGQSRRTVLASNRYALDNYEDRSFEVTLTYKKRTPLKKTRVISESFTLDFYSFAHTISVSSDLHDIARAAKKMADIT